MSGRPPLYPRLLRLHHLRLKPSLAFLYLEGSIGAATLLYLADIIPWWGIIVLPVTVAIMVKLNDIVAGAAPVATPIVATVAPAVGISRAAPRGRPGPIRGASARRTREIVGRARLGTARGIVYVHPKPGSLRRPASGTEDAPAAAPSTPDAATTPDAPPTGADAVSPDAPPTGTHAVSPDAPPTGTHAVSPDAATAPDVSTGPDQGAVPDASTRAPTSPEPPATDPRPTRRAPGPRRASDGAKGRASEMREGPSGDTARDKPERNKGRFAD